jgi:hypothetical protein
MRIISETRREPKSNVNHNTIVRMYRRWEKSSDPTPFKVWAARHAGRYAKPVA